MIMHGRGRQGEPLRANLTYCCAACCQPLVASVADFLRLLYWLACGPKEPLLCSMGDESCTSPAAAAAKTRCIFFELNIPG